MLKRSPRTLKSQYRLPLSTLEHIAASPTLRYWRRIDLKGHPCGKKRDGCLHLSHMPPLQWPCWELWAFCQQYVMKLSHHQREQRRVHSPTTCGTINARGGNLCGVGLKGRQGGNISYKYFLLLVWRGCVASTIFSGRWLQVVTGTDEIDDTQFRSHTINSYIFYLCQNSWGLPFRSTKLLWNLLRPFGKPQLLHCLSARRWIKSIMSLPGNHNFYFLT